jgi:hypothetical protein
MPINSNDFNLLKPKSRKDLIVDFNLGSLVAIAPPSTIAPRFFGVKTKYRYFPIRKFFLFYCYLYQKIFSVHKSSQLSY